MQQSREEERADELEVPTHDAARALRTAVAFVGAPLIGLGTFFGIWAMTDWSRAFGRLGWMAGLAFGLAFFVIVRPKRQLDLSHYLDED